MFYKGRKKTLKLPQERIFSALMHFQKLSPQSHTRKNTNQTVSPQRSLVLVRQPHLTVSWKQKLIR